MCTHPLYFSSYHGPVSHPRHRRKGRSCKYNRMRQMIMRCTLLQLLYNENEYYDGCNTIINWCDEWVWILRGYNTTINGRTSKRFRCVDNLSFPHVYYYLTCLLSNYYRYRCLLFVFESGECYIELFARSGNHNLILDINTMFLHGQK